ncbi:MAG: cbb3-type cytochrome c oxidase subunit I [Flavobacterium sp.]|jgi:cytochrome c oxidase subunit 1|uniref:Cytochrome c oxidase subunit 1 n=2 Tax=Flavobacterium TaxID=237 RepID=A0A1G5AK85_9FLAO|nr:MULTISPECIES: cbb3-type cytochrome c oxidase subunit I [Flavobacterium]AOC94107.1 Alternative cytochrome c oxidase subunit 1 [Flavobacterium anhuiense]EJG00586.1 cytochrome-c oxidase [Flavobacterium sp. F52]KAF2326883.1 cytochrome c oxidase subunit I [Flavobacterium nitrogenifigens]MBO9583588.1 cbb3-type cytochrome c oxidase subunit I [Flavobacterium sp.]MXO03787.1 cytochrome c oxidase subunit I [Flavobacterium sp. HBTb2-11-1]
MSAEAHGHDHGHDHEHEHHHKDTFITKYIFSIDHKMIAKQYLITGIVMGVIGIAMSLLFRMQLAWPEESFKIFNVLLGDKFAPDGVMANDIYLALVTIHGTIMVFFVLTAGLSGTFSNLLIPLQIGARDMASGFMNMISYWLFFLSAVVMLCSLFVEAGPASAGWTIYPPLSALPQAIPGSGTGMTLWLVSMAIFIASSLMGSLNYIVTVLNLRTKGMSMTRLPLTIWTFFVTAIIGVISFPVLLSAALLLIFDRSFGTSFFLSDIYIAGEVLHYQGGSPVLFEHLFWFLGHPEVYIVILPAMGLVSEIMATNARKPIFGYRAMIMSVLAIAFLSTIVWGHHMFISGMNPFLGSVFTFTTLLIAIPSAVKAFNWITTLWKGNLQFNPAMLFSIGMVSTFITGGLTGIILGDSTLDINVHDTYFVIAHFHLVMGISALYGMFAGIYHWFPKMYGRMLNKNLGYIHFWVTAVCAYGVFFPMHFIGLAGLPRRYYTNTNFPLFDDLQNVNVLITTFALVGGAFQLVFLYNFFSSIFYGKKATQNPWKSTTLEWTTPVEHIHGNWPGEIPHVYRWPYDYSNPNHDVDFVPQNVPMKEGEEVLHH